MESGALVDDDEEFEFSFECSSLLPASPVRADVVFYDWKMKQLFPMISSGGEITEETEENIIINHVDQNVNVNDNVGAVGSRREMKPLWELMKLEKEFAFSSDAAADGDYNNSPAGGGKKGKSIWSCRFLDLLRKGKYSMHGGVVSAAADVGRSRAYKAKNELGFQVFIN